MRWKTRSGTHGFQQRVWLWRKNEICGYLGFFFEGNAQIWAKFGGKLTYFPRTRSRRIRLPQNEGVLPQNQQEKWHSLIFRSRSSGKKRRRGKKSREMRIMKQFLRFWVGSIMVPERLDQEWGYFPPKLL